MLCKLSFWRLVPAVGAAPNIGCSPTAGDNTPRPSALPPGLLLHSLAEACGASEPLGHGRSTSISLSSARGTVTGCVRA
jgi:hypothetical protein